MPRKRPAHQRWAGLEGRIPLVLRSGSVTRAARELAVTPSQVSKAIARLEAFLKTRLVARSCRGITPTDQAKHLRSQLEELVRRTEELPRARRVQSRLTVIAPSYLAHELFGPIAERLTGVHLRALEAGAASIRVYAEEDAIDVAFTLSSEKLSPNEAMTAAVAFEIAAWSHQLAYGPEIAAASSPADVSFRSTSLASHRMAVFTCTPIRSRSSRAPTRKCSRS